MQGELKYEDLTPEQFKAIEDWWEKNDPNGISFDYADNFRMAIAGNAEQVDAYETRRSSGCCGYVDDEIELPDGTTLLYGFNYGH